MSKLFDASGALNGRSDRARDTFDCSEGLAASATLTAHLEHMRNIFLFRPVPPDSLPRQKNATASGLTALIFSVTHSGAGSVDSHLVQSERINGDSGVQYRIHCT